MKKTLLTVLLLCSLVACDSKRQELVDPEIVEGKRQELVDPEIVRRDGIAYLARSTEPLTADVVERDENGQLRAQYTFIDGKGEGVPQSHAEAFIWTSISAKSGDSGAVDIRNFAGGNLSAEELDTAENRISQLYENIKLREIHN